jgi:hypothetical protein
MTTYDDELVHRPTPQDWGLLEKPSWQQRECWGNQERFLAEFVKRGKVYSLQELAASIRRL